MISAIDAFPQGNDPYDSDKKLSKRFPKLWKRIKRNK